MRLKSIVAASLLFAGSAQAQVVTTYFPSMEPREVNESKHVAALPISKDVSYELALEYDQLRKQISDIVRQEPEVLLMVGETTKLPSITVETNAQNTFSKIGYRIYPDDEDLISITQESLDIIYETFGEQQTFTTKINTEGHGGYRQCNFALYVALREQAELCKNQISCDTDIYFVHVTQDSFSSWSEGSKALSEQLDVLIQNSTRN